MTVRATQRNPILNLPLPPKKKEKRKECMVSLLLLRRRLPTSVISFINLQEISGHLKISGKIIKGSWCISIILKSLI